MNARIFPTGRQMMLATALLAFVSACQTANDAETQPPTAASTGEIATTPTPSSPTETTTASRVYATAAEVYASFVGKCVVGGSWKECFEQSTFRHVSTRSSNGTWSAVDDDSGAALVTLNYANRDVRLRRILLDGEKVSFVKLNGNVRAMGMLQDDD